MWLAQALKTIKASRAVHYAVYTGWSVAYHVRLSKPEAIFLRLLPDELFRSRPTTARACFKPQTREKQWLFFLRSTALTSRRW